MQLSWVIDPSPGQTWLVEIMTHSFCATPKTCSRAVTILNLQLGPDQYHVTKIERSEAGVPHISLEGPPPFATIGVPVVETRYKLSDQSSWKDLEWPTARSSSGRT